MKLLHQCGHCTNWNIDSYSDEQRGDGLILSPVHQARQKVEALPAALRRVSIFDAQYYLPNSQKAKLHSYDFFPEVVSGGFSTAEFGLVALESAKLCLEFQIRCGFERIVIPARYFGQMDPDYTAKQEAYTVAPFLKQAAKLKLRKPLYVTLPLTSHMIQSEPYRTTVLNWVTSFPEIDGVYVIPYCERSTKQIQSETFLDEMLRMLTELKDAGLKVLVGYSNTESLLYSLVGDIDTTIGAYENTRMFSMDKFVEAEEDRRGPKARIYLPALLNWIQFNQANELRRNYSELWRRAYGSTSHAEAAFRQATEPTFNQPVLYRHYFQSFAEQMEKLRPLARVERYRMLRSWIKGAMELHEEIKDAPVDLDRHGNGEHLQPWLNVINRYYAANLKS